MLEIDHAIGGSERGFTSREGCILEATFVEYIWSSLRLVLTTLQFRDYKDKSYSRVKTSQHDS